MHGRILGGVGAVNPTLEPVERLLEEAGARRGRTP